MLRVILLALQEAILAFFVTLTNSFLDPSSDIFLHLMNSYKAFIDEIRMLYFYPKKSDFMH